MNDQEFQRMMADLEEVLAYDWPFDITLDDPMVAAASLEGAAANGSQGDATPAWVIRRVPSGLAPPSGHGLGNSTIPGVLDFQRDHVYAEAGSTFGQQSGSQGWELRDSGLLNTSEAIGGTSLPGSKVSQVTAASPRPTIKICYGISDVPPGRQPAKILQCGLCSSGKLFDRAYEIKRHMDGHFLGQYACGEPGCDRVGVNAFTRKDKLVKHMRETHGGS